MAAVWFLLLALGALFDVAAAGGSVETTLFSAQLDDGRGETCSPPASGWCLSHVEGNDLGTTYVDGYQEVHYVGIAFNGSRVRSLDPALDVLPDSGVTIRGDDLVVRHPVIRTFDETWNDRPPLPTDDSAGLETSPRNLTVKYIGPSVWAPTDLAHHTYVFEWSGPLSYDGTSRINTPRGDTTDNYSKLASLACVVVRNTVCESATDETRHRLMSAGPNVRVGLELHTVQVASDPSMLEPPADHGAIRMNGEVWMPKEEAAGAPVLPLPASSLHNGGPLSSPHNPMDRSLGMCRRPGERASRSQAFMDPRGRLRSRVWRSWEPR